MTVKKLQNAYLVTRAMDRAVAFYREALGLALKFQDGARWAQFDAGGTNVSLSAPEEAADGACGAVLVFEVDDLEAAAARVAAHGGTLGARRDMGTHGRTLTVRDPDGNVIQLFQRAG